MKGLKLFHLRDSKYLFLYFRYLKRDVRELTDSSYGLVEEYYSSPQFHKFSKFEDMIRHLEDIVSLNTASSFSHYVKLHYEQEILCDFLMNFPIC
jgi:hypothetical protein